MLESHGINGFVRRVRPKITEPASTSGSARLGFGYFISGCIPIIDSVYAHTGSHGTQQRFLYYNELVRVCSPQVQIQVPKSGNRKEICHVRAIR